MDRKTDECDEVVLFTVLQAAAASFSTSRQVQILKAAAHFSSLNLRLIESRNNKIVTQLQHYPEMV